MTGRIRRFFRRRLRETPGPEAVIYRRDVVTAEQVDFFALAHMLIDLHRARARAEAARLIQEAQNDGDAEATADWLAVERAIALLTGDCPAARH